MAVAHKTLLFEEFAAFQTSPHKRMEALLAIAEEFLWLPLETQQAGSLHGHCVQPGAGLLPLLCAPFVSCAHKCLSK